MKKQKYTLPIVALALASFLWGLNTPLNKMGLESIPAVTYTALRFLIASLILLPFALKSWRPLKRKDLLLLILCSIFWITLSSLALNIGLEKTSAINASVLWMLGPLLLFVLSVEFLKERLSIKTFLGIIVALIGSIIVIGKPWDGSGEGLSSLTGNLFVIIAVLFDVIATLLFKPLMKKVSNYQATFMSLFPGVIPLVIYSATQHASWDIKATSTESWFGLIASTVLVLIANVLFFYALRYKQAQSTGVYRYIDALTAIAASMVILSEKPSPKFIVGTILIFIGVYVAEARFPRKLMHHHHKRHA